MPPATSQITLLFALVAAACQPPTPAAGRDRVDPGVAIEPARLDLPAPASPLKTPRFIQAEAATDLRAQIATEYDAANKAGDQLVVYVGAPWCEPCTVFHDAVEAGAYDKKLADVRFLEFNADKDTSALHDAGYSFQYIPLFVAPNPDGSPSELRVQGGIKGPRAAQHIWKRLDPLLRRAKRP